MPEKHGLRHEMETITIKGLKLEATDKITGKKYKRFELLFHGDKAFGVPFGLSTEDHILELSVIVGNKIEPKG